MKPLREHLDDPDLAIRAGAALLAKVQPFELSSMQRRRIRARIDAAAEQPRGMAWLRPAFALPVLLVVGVAGATVGPRLYRAVVPQSSFEQSPPSAQPAAPVVPAHARAAPAAAPAQAGSIAPEDLEAEKPTPTQHAAPSGPGATLMMEALQARRAGDTARAQQLTLEYQKKYPNGALKEEALAIAFESAAARKDASAARLAQKYLAAFPHGRFRAQAEQVLSNH
jgi:TolA-binding protein